jgi:hypothetical protein
VANLLAVNRGLVEPPEKTLIAQDHQFRDTAYVKVNNNRRMEGARGKQGGEREGKK